MILPAKHVAMCRVSTRQSQALFPPTKFAELESWSVRDLYKKIAPFYFLNPHSSKLVYIVELFFFLK
jgi:hypothetical protein